MGKWRLNNRGSCYFSESSSPGYYFRSPYFDSSTSIGLPPAGLRSPGGHAPDQTLESSFSRLSIWSNDQPQAPSFGNFPEGYDDVADPLTGCYYSSGLGSAGFQQGSSSSMGFRNDGGQELGFGGAHVDLMVGPGNGGCRASSSGSSGAVCRDAWSLEFRDELDSNDNLLGLYDHSFSFLQSKKPLPSTMNSQFQSFQYSDQDFKPFVYFHDHSMLKKSTSCGNLLNNSHLSRCLDPFESLSLLDFKGSIVALAKDQIGSSILQEKLEKNPKEDEIEIVLFEVVDYVADLMKDYYGSGFMLKLFTVCGEEQRTVIIRAATKTSFQFGSICLNAHGYHIVLKLLEELSTPEQISLVTSALNPGVVRLSTDPSGQHVIRYCLQNFSHEYNKYLFSEIKKNCFELATDKSGCRVLKCCVDFAQGEAKEQLIKEIIRNSLRLAQDQYGNYVVQHLLEKKTSQITTEIIQQLQGHFALLSCGKHGSHVVEKFLNDCGEGHTRKIIMELLTTTNPAMLLLDPFANFVMQTALSVAKGQPFLALCKLIQVNAPKMRSNLYGRKVLNSFEKRKSKNV